MSRITPASFTKLRLCGPFSPSAGRIWVIYSSNFAASRLKPGVETFARLFAITSIARYAASCWERLTRSELSMAPTRILSGPSYPTVQRLCQHKNPGFVGFFGGRGRHAEKLAERFTAHPAI